MVEIEVDGRKVEVVEGSMVMHAANALGVYVPHFCYHKKLSIAANCRMCLVDVEKAPKPLPACATPVSQGMKVWTKSEKAVKAQKGVMEFLLINHPLDCPICDQGGECQLQDLAVGYGPSASRYTEEKRVVFHKSMGPLISAEEMSRCIHCTRCVRFGQEIAGVMELGMAGRGEHSEIMSFVGRGVESELSGNMIDVCPVGALTSKPFRYSARTWELARRKTVAAHDSLGSNVIVQVKQNAVMRVLPLENESINECWISDRDRFSYEGLNATERLERPMLKQDGQWHEVDWQVALDYAAHALGSVRAKHGAASIGGLAHPQSTVEELFLLSKLVRGLGSENVDFRLRASDAALAQRMQGAPWLGMPIEAVNGLDRVLLVGSFLRKDQPLLASRVRAAVKRGARVAVLHAADDDLLMPVAAKAIVSPDRWAETLAGALVALKQGANEAVPAELAGIEPSEGARALAATLSQGKAKAVFLGAAVARHPQAAAIAALAQALAAATGATLGWLVDGANAVGGHLAGALPGAGGLDAAAMVDRPLKAYLLLGVEPGLDHGRGAAARAAVAGADTVIALTAFRSAELLETADCLLPVAPFTETAGAFVNLAGTVQAFTGVVRPRGDARPAWKVLRVLGNLLQLPGFDQESVEQVRVQALPSDVLSKLSNAVSGPVSVPRAGGGLQRVADVPIYAVDPIVRRAPSLQMTRDAAAPTARMNAATLAALGLAAGDAVIAKQGPGSATLVAALDGGVADGTVRIAAATELTAALGDPSGPITVERAR
ncbi:MAG: NADH-quinone oxidoreductase subunit NuoG [Burkholderiales bacterium]|jgi:NADH-quinone oxidoreductase subunit G